MDKEERDFLEIILPPRCDDQPAYIVTALTKSNEKLYSTTYDKGMAIDIFNCYGKEEDVSIVSITIACHVGEIPHKGSGCNRKLNTMQKS